MMGYQGGAGDLVIGQLPKFCDDDFLFPVQQPPVISFLPAVSMPPSAQSRQSVEATVNLSEIDLRPWLEAARNFEMNMDFAVNVDPGSAQNNLDSLMDTMKSQSDNKWTIQALADKIMLSRMLDNLGVPQMPALLIVENADVDTREIEHFVLRHLCGPNSCDVVVKPTHMSNAAGVINVSRPTPSEGPQMTIDYLAWHLKHYMNEKAGSYESAALQSARPGFIVQPKYESVIDFKAPLEVRVVVLWGKARLAVWWWGHAGSSPHCHRNVWLVRTPAQRGELSDRDTWQVIHMHKGTNQGFEKAIELFERHIGVMADLAEVIATAAGAPFLRSDFFVGSPQWGVRLNEVAYGSGIEYVNFSDNPKHPVVDDSSAIAQILREGYFQCQRRIASQHFLSKLGVRGRSYADMTVVPLPPQLRPPLPPRAACAGPDPHCIALAVRDELCETVKEVVMGPPRTPSRTPSKSRNSIPSLQAQALSEAQNAIQWTPRASQASRQPMSARNSVEPRRLSPAPRAVAVTPRPHGKAGMSPRQLATPPPTANAGPSTPLWNSSGSFGHLPNYKGKSSSAIVPPAAAAAVAPATPAATSRSCRISTPAMRGMRSPMLQRGPQRGSPSAQTAGASPSSSSLCGGSDMASLAWRGLAAETQKQASSGYPLPEPQLSNSPGPAIRWRGGRVGNSVTIPTAHSGETAWRHPLGSCSAMAPPALGGPNSEAMATPTAGYRAPRMLPTGAPSMTPPLLPRASRSGTTDMASTLRAARSPQRTALLAPWQGQSMQAGYFNSCTPPSVNRRCLLATSEGPSLGHSVTLA